MHNKIQNWFIWVWLSCVGVSLWESSTSILLQCEQQESYFKSLRCFYTNRSAADSMFIKGTTHVSIWRYVYQSLQNSIQKRWEYFLEEERYNFSVKLVTRFNPTIKILNKAWKTHISKQKKEVTVSARQ